MRFIPNIKYNELENSFVDLYLPDGACKDLIIWFHGGGFVNLDRTKIAFAEDLTKEGVAVASVEYRMYTHGARFPDFIVDGANAIKFLQDNIKQYADVERIFVSGQSAGAYLTLMLAFDQHYLRDAGVDPMSIAGFISDSAQTTTHFNVLKRDRDTNGNLERIDDAAPLYFVNPDLKLNSLLLIYYTNDVKCRPEQNKLLYASIKKLCPDIKTELVELPGKHTNGSEHRNEQGTFDYNDTVLKFINDL